MTELLWKHSFLCTDSFALIDYKENPKLQSGTRSEYSSCSLEKLGFFTLHGHNCQFSALGQDT